MNSRKLITALLLPLFFLFFANAAFAQRTVTGRVTDIRGEGIASVTVAAKGSNVATATDATGHFSLTVPSQTTTLVFTSVGFGSQEQTIRSGEMNVSLSPLAGNLNEVVVVGYGTQRRRDVTGSVATISSKDFNKGLNTTPDQLIMGKVAGVEVTPNGGAPGSGSVIRIRGGASLNANNDPLVVIDGVPVSNYGVGGVYNILGTLNPNDIESINILKDASATAIYGSRASNGVMLITTKKGARGGKVKISFSALGSMSERTKSVEVLNGDQLRTYVNANGNAGQKALLGTANTNWQDAIFRKAYAQDYNIGMSGGFKPLPYRLNLGYLNQDGILITSNQKRYSAALGLFPSLLDNHLNFTMNGKFARTESRFADEAAIGRALSFDPTQPIYMKNGPAGYFEWLDPVTGIPIPGVMNPVSRLVERDNRGYVDRFLGNVQVDYKLHWFPALRVNANVGIDDQRGHGRELIRPGVGSQLSDAGTATDPGTRRFGTGDIYRHHNVNKLAEVFLNYNKNYESIHSLVDLTAGYSYQDFLFQTNNYTPLTYTGVQAPKTTLPLYPKTTNEQTLLSYYGRLNYTFSERYSLTATLRRDASSVFRKDLRWGTFPAVGLAWHLKDESFLKDSKLFSELKLRGGWGVTGQQDIVSNVGYYPYIASYFQGDSNSMYQFGNTYYASMAPGAYNANLKWEETKTINLGVDFGFLKGRLNGSIDLFKKTSNDLLADVPFALGTNFTNQFIANIGSMEAKGVEFGLNANPVKTKDFNWDLGFNATLLERKITKLQNHPDSSFVGIPVGGIGGGTGGTIQIHSIGYAPNTFYVQQQVYDANGKPIEGLYVDRNKDGIINEKDYYHYKQPMPPTQLGFNSQLSYKQLSLGFSMRASLGNYLYNNVNSGRVGTSILIQNAAYLGNATTDFLNTGFKARAQTESDYYVENASFLKMDYISLGYNFGKISHSRVGLRASANVQNVFVVTKYSGVDPEHFNGIDNQIYPRPRTYSLGISLDY
jgi:TonB-dependent starch-binding outer membrane protein SusC